MKNKNTVFWFITILLILFILYKIIRGFASIPSVIDENKVFSMVKVYENYYVDRSDSTLRKKDKMIDTYIQVFEGSVKDIRVEKSHIMGKNRNTYFTIYTENDSIVIHK